MGLVRFDTTIVSASTCAVSLEQLQLKVGRLLDPVFKSVLLKNTHRNDDDGCRFGGGASVNGYAAAGDGLCAQLLITSND